MKRLLAAALLAATLPAFSQQGGWSDISSSWREIQNPPVTFSIIPTPAGCVATSVPIFLGSPVALGCDAGLTYDAATDTLTVAGTGRIGRGYSNANATGFLINTTPDDGWGTVSLDYAGEKRFSLASAYHVSWTATTNAGNAADSGLRRVSAGLVGVTSGGSNLGSLQAGNYTATALANPTITSVTRVGTTGTANNVYGVVAYLNDGTSTAISAGASGGATSNAVLDGTNYNVITWPAVANAAYYKLFRYYTESDPFTSGMIYTGTALTFNDTGIVGDGTTAPTTNTTGRVLVGDGSAAAPSVAFASAPTTGLSVSPTGALELNSNGNRRLTADSSGVTLGGPLGFAGGGPYLIWDGGAQTQLTLGKGKNATPVANTLIIGESGSGTDIPGGNGVIQSGAGTGSGAGSTLTFKTPTPGASGETAQTQTTRLVLGPTGINVPGLATYADNAAALTGGLVAGDLYRTSTGVLMVTY